MMMSSMIVDIRTTKITILILIAAHLILVLVQVIVVVHFLFTITRLTARGWRVVGLWQGSDLVAQDAANRAHRRHIVLVADPFGQQLIADLPGEYARIAVLVVTNLSDHFWGRDAWFRATDRARQYRACFLVAGEYLGDAAVRDLELTRDITWSDAFRRQVHYLHAHCVRQWSAVYEHST